MRRGLYSDTSIIVTTQSPGQSCKEFNQSRFSRKGAKTQRKDGQRDEDQTRLGYDYVNSLLMLFFAAFAALRETDLSSLPIFAE